MDPNANLQELRRLVGDILRGADFGDTNDPEFVTDQLKDATRLAELVEALDGWLSKGGSLPADWQKGRTS